MTTEESVAMMNLDDVAPEEDPGVTKNDNGSFSLNSLGMTQRQLDGKDPFGAYLVPINSFTGCRPMQIEAPLSKKAKKARREGKPKKEIKIKGLKKFQGSSSGATRETIIEAISNQLNDRTGVEEQGQLYVEKSAAYCIVLTINKRDIKDGAGERDLFYFMYLCLYDRFPETMKNILKLVVDNKITKDGTYGGYVDLNRLHNINHKDIEDLEEKMSETEKQNLPLRKELQSFIVDFYADALFKDHSSSAAKWAPRIGKHVDRISELGNNIALKLFPHPTDPDQPKVPSHKAYRELLAAILKDSPVQPIEQKLCAVDENGENNGWKGLAEGDVRKNLSKVPGKAMLKYKSAFLDEKKYGEERGDRRNPDDESRTKIRDTLLQMTEDVINQPENPEMSGLIKGAKTLMPHELVREQLNENTNDPVKQAQWISMVQETKKCGALDKTVVMSDVSGSMSGLPMDVSIALGLMISEIQEGPFHNRVMTFASDPQWFEINDSDDLLTKCRKLGQAPWGGSTNLEAAFKLILDTSVDAGLDQEDMPDKIIILTDMCFDAAVGGYGYYHNQNVDSGKNTHADMAKQAFIDKGYTPPAIILWNLQSHNISKNFQNRSDDQGVVNLAGFSIALLKSIMEGKALNLAYVTPIDILLETLEKKKYRDVHEAIADSSEFPAYRRHVEGDLKRKWEEMTGAGEMET